MSSSNTSKSERAFADLLNQYKTVSVDGHDIKVYRLGLKGFMSLTKLVGRIIGVSRAVNANAQPEDISSAVLIAFSNAEGEVAEILKDALREDESVVYRLTPTAIMKIATAVIEQEDIGEIAKGFFEMTSILAKTLSETG